METTKEEFKVALDSGNSEASFIEGDLLVRQPSIISKTRKNPFYEDLNLEDAVKNIYDQLVVSIQSPALSGGLPATYYIGKFASESTSSYSNTVLGMTEKHTGKVPVVVALGLVAARAVQRAHKKDPLLTQDIEATVDMATGLPVREFNSGTGDLFAERFTKGYHEVTVLLGKEKHVKVRINFDFVKVFPEAAPVVFSIVYDKNKKPRKGDIFKDFQEKYGWNPFDGSHFLGKRLLHIDIGDGTTEYVITEGLNPNQKLTRGTNNGIGHATENILDDYSKIAHIKNPLRQDVTEVIKNQNHKWYAETMELLQEEFEIQADEIAVNALKLLDVVRNEVDAVVVYGGGSIPLKEYLYPELDEQCAERRMDLFYVPEEYAATLFVQGLNIIIVNGLFDKLKKVAEEASLTN
ncbi:ParM/StbA family protein [Priestia aryabhattai]